MVMALQLVVLAYALTQLAGRPCSRGHTVIGIEQDADNMCLLANTSTVTAPMSTGSMGAQA